MAKTIEKNKAIELRKKGESIKEIAKKIGIAKSTVSLWCRDIKLTDKQINDLHQRMVMCGYKGRMIGARAQYNQRIEKIKQFKDQGIKEIGTLSNRELMIACVALYWAEGSKKIRTFSFCNSDPDMVKFFIKFLKDVLYIKIERLRPWIGINIIHEERVNEVMEYWSKITGIPKNQFTKTILIKAQNKKKYSNFPVHYGTISIRITKSASLLYRICGLIDGLKSAN
ncbi:MAG: helix-turn-helix domain-containing protein [bacterium]|nr:helix-turn-helix domain-containing protein [bacterium]